MLGCRFGGQCLSAPWRTEQIENETSALDDVTETRVLVTGFNQSLESLNDVFPILGRDQRFVVSFDIRDVSHVEFDQLEARNTEKLDSRSGLTHTLSTKQYP